MSLRDAFAPWRKWFLSPEQIEERVVRAHGPGGARVAEETLANDPYNPALRRVLLRAHAAAGEAELYGEHLAVCFAIHDLDEEAVRADPELRGSLSEAVLARAIEEATKVARAARTRDFCFDEIAPRSNRFTTTLSWSIEHQDAVRAAHARFARLSARTETRYVFPGRAGPEAHAEHVYAHHVRDGTVDLESDSMPGGFCPLGVALQFVRDVARYVDDVRFFFYDQVSPLDEVWIVDHVFYIRRHPIQVYDFIAVVRYLDDLLLREEIRDPALGGFLAERMTSLAAGEISSISSPYLDPATHRREAEELMARAARHDGEQPPYLLAKLALLDGQVERAIAHLERLAERSPAWRQAMLELAHLYFAEERMAEALDMCDRVVALGDRADDDAHLLRGRALIRLGRQREAMTAYRRHAKVIRCYPGVLLRNGKALLEEGQYQAAGILFKPIVRERFATGVAAELGLARCADGLGDRDRALEHYRRVLARAPELKRRYADSPDILARIEQAEQAARVHAEAR